MLPNRIAVTLIALLAAQAPAPSPKVGPARGTVMAVGGSVAPEILAKFVELAGGPDALILDIPTAGLDNEISGGDLASEIIARWKAAGARNVQVLHTRDRKVADTDVFVEPIKKAGGVWFDGGRPELIIDTYAGTKADREFRQVLERGGVLAGTSAGAVALGNLFTNSLQADFSNLTTGEGFGILRGVAFQPHAGNPNPSYLANHPELIRLAMPEVTAWIVRGDTAEVFGSSNAFAYRDDPRNPGKPYITFRPGDRYNLATHEVFRAIDSSPLTETYIDSLFAEFAKPGAPEATVLVAQDGKILADKSYNIPPQPRDAPTTVSPTFTLGGIADAFNAIAVQVLAADDKLSLDVMNRDRREVAQAINRVAETQLAGTKSAHEGFFRQQILGGVGSLISPTRVVGDITTGEFVGSVDPLHTWEMRLEQTHIFGSKKPLDTTFGWNKEPYRGLTRLSLFGTKDGKRHAFVRIPDKRISVIILTNKDDLDARAIAERITDRLLETSR